MGFHHIIPRKTWIVNRLTPQSVFKDQKILPFGNKALQAAAYFCSARSLRLRLIASALSERFISIRLIASCSLCPMAWSALSLNMSICPIALLFPIASLHPIASLCLIASSDRFISARSLAWVMLCPVRVLDLTLWITCSVVSISFRQAAHIGFVFSLKFALRSVMFCSSTPSFFSAHYPYGMAFRHTVSD